MNILTISGSQRTGSFNTALIQAIPELASEGHTFTQLDYSNIPVYNQDLETDFPQEVTTLKDRIRSADALIIATPEYNRSIPAPLKNMLDWTSRPYGDGAWTGKPVYVFGASVAPTGAALAQADLRKVLLYLGATVPGQTELYIGSASQKVSPEGVLTDDATKEQVRRALTAFLSSLA